MDLTHLTKELGNFILKLEQAINNDVKLKTLGGILEQLKNNSDNTQPHDDFTSIDELFKVRIKQLSVYDFLKELDNELDFDVLDEHLIMSESFAKKLLPDIKSMRKQINEIMTYIWNYLSTVQIKFKYDAKELLEKFNKYKCANTLTFLLERIYHASDVTSDASSDAASDAASDEINITLEKIKTELFDLLDFKLSKNLYLNILQSFGYSKTGFVSLDEIFSLNKTTKNTSKKPNISNIAKSVGPILVIYRSTSIKYDTWKLTEQSDRALSAELVRNTNVINRCEISGLNEVTLYVGNKEINILSSRKNRYISNDLIELVGKTQYVLETLDGHTFRRLHISKPLLLHLLNGPNNIIQNYNNEAEKAILEHWKGAKELNWTSSSIPIAYIRENIKTKMLDYFKKKGVDVEHFKVIFDTEMFAAFRAYTGTNNFSPIVQKEGMISFISDVHIRSNRFVREFNNAFNKIDLKSFKKNEQYTELEKIIVESLESSVNESSNIFNRVNDKNVLLF